MVEITLDLSRHCVETEIRRRYNQALSDYFKSSGDRQAIEAKIALLQHALKNLDFLFMRSRYPALAGGSDAEVVLSDAAETGLAVWIDGTAIALQ